MFAVRGPSWPEKEANQAGPDVDCPVPGQPRPKNKRAFSVVHKAA